LCGIEVFKSVFLSLSPSFSFKFFFRDGEKIEKGDIVAVNFIQRLSGIATETKKLVEKTEGKVKIYDTRKTTPNLRILEKYAVKTGGGYNHRFGLYDIILIKDNHISALMKKEGINKISAFLKGKKKVEIEWSGNVSLKKIEEIRKLPVDRVSVGYITHSAKALDFSLKIK